MLYLLDFSIYYLADYHRKFNSIMKHVTSNYMAFKWHIL